MAYSARARDLRRCQYVYPATGPRGAPHARAGEGCQAWARWDAADGCCTAHSVGPDGRRYTRGNGRETMEPETLTRAVCTCRAYAYPHRPGGGLCRWPDAPVFSDTREAGGDGPRMARRPKWYPSRTRGAPRRAFDVTPDGVRRRSRAGAAASMPSLPGGRVPGEDGPVAPTRPAGFLDGLIADGLARGLLVADASAPGGYRVRSRAPDVTGPEAPP